MQEDPSLPACSTAAAGHDVSFLADLRAAERLASRFIELLLLGCHRRLTMPGGED